MKNRLIQAAAITIVFLMWAFASSFTYTEEQPGWINETANHNVSSE